MSEAAEQESQRRKVESVASTVQHREEQNRQWAQKAEEIRSSAQNGKTGKVLSGPARPCGSDQTSQGASDSGKHDQSLDAATPPADAKQRIDSVAKSLRQKFRGMEGSEENRLAFHESLR